MGGNIRVGMEDNLRIRKNEYARNNAELLEKAVKIIEVLDRRVANPDDTHEILGLKGKENVDI